ADRADAPVRRLSDRQSLDGEPPATAPLATAATAGPTAPSSGWCGGARRAGGDHGAAGPWRCAHGGSGPRSGERIALDVVHVVLRWVGLDEAERTWRPPGVHIDDMGLGIVGAAGPHRPSATDRHLDRG